MPCHLCFSRRPCSCCLPEPHLPPPRILHPLNYTSLALMVQMAPYRESLSRLLAGTELSGAPYYLLTYASLALFYFVAMHSGSIWVPLQFVGATAGALICQHGRAAEGGGVAGVGHAGVLLCKLKRGL